MAQSFFTDPPFSDPADNTALEKLYKELFGADTLGTVIRVSIRIEEQLDEYFESRAQNPEFIGRMKLEFGQKVLLAIALGLREDLRTPLLAFGQIRNSYAHKPDYQLGKSEVRNFYKTLTSDQQMVVQGFSKMSNQSAHQITMGEPDTHLDTFRWIIIVLHLHVTSWRRLSAVADALASPMSQPRLR